jgi:ATP-binding protein involved in chromosome partitioning
MSYFIAPDTGNKYDIFGIGGGQNLAEQLNTDFLGGIPIDPRIRKGGDEGNPIVYALPDTEESKIIIDIAKKLGEHAASSKESANDIEIEL